MNNKIRKILEKVISHYDLDIQWWDNVTHKKEEGYKEVKILKTWLKKNSQK